MREGSLLGEDLTIATASGERAFAVGDRVMFLRNERSLGVKNGSLGEVKAIGEGGLSVQLDGGRQVSFDLKNYNHLDHGYASTIHKSQGVTVDRAHVLASAHMDRHATYVALSRHRLNVSLHYDRETFVDRRALESVLSRERVKDTTLDYAERRGMAAPAGRQGGMFTGFRPRPQQPDLSPSREPQIALGREAAPSQQVQQAIDLPGLGKGRGKGLEL